jgi:hypothetical protein
MRGILLTLLAGGTLATWAASASAQTPVRFVWHQGQTMTYKVDQTTSASDEVEGQKTETSSKMTTVKRWQVLAVDASGVGTLQLSLKSLRFEVKTPKDTTLIFDSTELDKNDPQLREQMAKYVGPPVSLLRVDALGRVVEVKESKQAPASRFDSELPFVIQLPAAELQPGSAWERSYQVTLEPPQGTGDKYQAVQKYACQKIEGPAVTISFITAIKNLPSGQLDQVPLLEMQPEGEVIFDSSTGQLIRARLRIDKELKGLQGEGSRYHFESTYTEQILKD